jgi:ribosomal protein S5
MCELIGIKDIECTLEGAHNPLHMAKAFFLGLLRQRTHQVRVVNTLEVHKSKMICSIHYNCSRLVTS